MAPTPLPTNSDQPVGATTVNKYVRINNDYLYPRRTVPHMLPNTVGGLVRGWIYPMDVDQKLVAGSQARDEGLREQNITEYTNAADAARQEAARAAAQERRRAELADSGLSEDIIEQAVAAATPQVGDLPSQTFSPLGYDTSPLAQSNRGGTPYPKTIREREGKQFQFNPFSVDLSFALTPTAPPESLQPGGTASTTLMTNASTGVQMYFDRSIEVSASNAGKTYVNGYPVDIDFKNIGVQKDIWDVFRICLGGDDDYFAEIGRSLGNIEQISGQSVLRGSTTDMMSRVFDIGMSSAQAWGRPVAVYYNANFVINGFVNGIRVTYAEFNANFVPTKAIIDLALSVYQVNSESGVSNTTAATTDTTDTTTATTTTGGGDVPNASASTRPGTIVVAQSGTGTNFTVSGTNLQGSIV